MSSIELTLNDRDQWHSQIAHFFKQAMQRSLINYRSRKKRIAILLQRDRQALEPVCPLTVQLTPDPDLIDHGLQWIKSVVE